MSIYPVSSNAATATERFNTPTNSPFYKNKEEGWYWYQDPEEEEKTVVQPPPPSAPVAEAKPSEGQADTPFSVEWVRKMLPRYMDKAWDDPTPENVQAYFLVQKFALDRSQEFSRAAQRVVMGNYLLDETMQRPTSTAGVTLVNQTTSDNKDKLLKKLTDKVGIFFFFKSSCPYCEKQAPVIGMLESKGFSVLAISMDGGQLQTRQFAHTKVNQGQAEKLGVEAVPAIYLMNGKGEFDLIAQSIVSLTDLERRIFVAAERQGWLTPEEIDQTRFLMNPESRHNLSKEVPQMVQALKQQDLGSLMGSDKEKFKHIIAMSDADKKSLQDKDGFIEPTKLIALLSKDGKAKAYPNSGKLTPDEQKDFEHEKPNENKNKPED